MSWQETAITMVAITFGMTLLIVLVLQLSKIIGTVVSARRERVLRELATELRAGQEHLSAEVAEIRRVVEETGRRVREVDY
ncbi:hypothetical protein [Amycolatopsis albispora]|uniref:Uncharacterized protein n=1 Tax=Amycolatopsis albispora TaxID=1804986 RepID=A0A344LEU5_9PSEU|nr:hypothetical protein [Amycolatopsis albispora]AXB46569.1 hypothetical protein A4R43_32375 [Amycolatopsis albispora]